MSSCALLPITIASRLSATQTSQVRAFSKCCSLLSLQPSLWLAICWGWKPRSNAERWELDALGQKLYLVVSDFPLTEQIFLEQNYRSTRSILNASLAIVAQGMFRCPPLQDRRHGTSRSEPNSQVLIHLAPNGKHTRAPRTGIRTRWSNQYCSWGQTDNSSYRWSSWLRRCCRSAWVLYCTRAALIWPTLSTIHGLVAHTWKCFPDGRHTSPFVGWT